jgi:hypothetical protein
MGQPETPRPCPVSLVIDIHSSCTVALTQARARLVEVIAKLRKHGITATPVRVDIQDYPEVTP